jgi:hypothetical protein
MKKDQIREAILKATGYPDNGAIKESLEAMVNAVAAIDAPEEVRETRVTGPAETRASAIPHVIQ